MGATKPPSWFSFLRYEHAGRSLPLDLLRGVAILLVLGRHYVMAPTGLGWLQPLAAGWTRVGWAGVDLFFVLSGYLVSGLLFAEFRRRGAIDVRRFVIRRGFKIWPSYFVYLGFVWLWLWIAKHESAGDVLAALWPNFLHVQNYFHTPRIHTWSLAVEEHFYLVVAIVFWALLRRPGTDRTRRWIGSSITILVLALAAVRLLLFREIGGEQMNLYATHLRFDGLLIGTLLAYLTQFEPNAIAQIARHPLSAIAIGTALAVPTMVLTPEANAWTVSIGLSAMYVGFALIVVGTLNLERIDWGERLLRTRAVGLIAQIGFYSYSIYLWHVDLAQTPLKKIAGLVSTTSFSPEIRWIVLAAAYVCLASVAGYVLSRLIEMPSLTVRDRFFPKRQNVPIRSQAEPARVGAAPLSAGPVTAAVPRSAPESAAAG